jgi:glycosyltransferase involved in cell wall biosynthesis
MIVKNEENVIERCLSKTLPHVSCWSIVDTGSTDSTKEIIHRMTAEHGKPGTLHERPWLNFGHNRTEALELAKGQGAQWLFMMDADDIFVGSFHTQLDPSLDGYTINMHQGNIQYRNTLLFNIHSHWVYKFPVHEYPLLHNAKTAQLDGLFIESRREGARSRNPNKYTDDAIMLEAQFKTGEFEDRAAFYAAQSWRDAGNKASAAQWYGVRAAMGGWKDEVYISYLNLIHLTDDMDAKLAYAWKALAADLLRKEVPHAILEAFRKKSLWNLQAYAIGLLAFKIKESPSPNSLFLDQETYKFYDEFSIISFYTGNIQEAQESVKIAFLSAPREEEDRILKNIEFIYN